MNTSLIGVGVVLDNGEVDYGLIMEFRGEWLSEEGGSLFRIVAILKIAL